MENKNLLEILQYINPTTLNYQEWVNVGMALKEEGYTPGDWDEWSRKDSSRYHRGECEKKWNSFQGNPSPVTAGTIVQIAKEQGWEPGRTEYELDWNDIIGATDDLVVVDKIG